MPSNRDLHILYGATVVDMLRGPPRIMAFSLSKPLQEFGETERLETVWIFFHPLVPPSAMRRYQKWAAGEPRSVLQGLVLEGLKACSDVRLELKAVHVFHYYSHAQLLFCLAQ